jgi:hypothetical protein
MLLGGDMKIPMMAKDELSQLTPEQRDVLEGKIARRALAHPELRSMIDAATKQHLDEVKKGGGGQ